MSGSSFLSGSSNQGHPKFSGTSSYAKKCCLARPYIRHCKYFYKTGPSKRAETIVFDFDLNSSILILSFNQSVSLISEYTMSGISFVIEIISRLWRIFSAVFYLGYEGPVIWCEKIFAKNLYFRLKKSKFGEKMEIFV